MYTDVEGEVPSVGSRVTYHQNIYLNDSSIYSTYLTLQPKKAIMPSADSLPNPIPPDYEALMLMSAGDSLSVIQRLDTFSLSVLPRGVKNDDVFTYYMKVLEVQDSASVTRELQVIKAREKTVADSVQQYIQSFKEKTLTKELVTTENGLSYKMIKKGNGEKLESGQFVKVHYSGHLQSDGSNFDNTFKDGLPFTFRFDRKMVIPGWDEMLSYMQEGDQAIAFIPYSLAYGLAGRPPRIPEKADLVFFIEMVEAVNYGEK